MKKWFYQVMRDMVPEAKCDPTIFHITHYKAGSQWVYGVLAYVAPNRIVLPQIGADHVTRAPIQRGMIYPCVYLNRAQFKRVKKPGKKRCFLIIRDLRDTLISQYFSVKCSHEMLYTQMQRTRDRLNAMDLHDGLMMILENNLYISADIQDSWLGKADFILRYEDMLADEFRAFDQIFDYCGFRLSDEEKRAAVNAYSFENLAGRKPGDEDVNSHFRKAVVGDWKNYFDDELKKRFKERYGRVLIRAGYEKNNDW